MTTNKIIGIAALAVGVVLLGFGYNSTNAPMEQLSEAVTGRYSSETTWYIGLGIATIVGGGLLAAFGNRK